MVKTDMSRKDLFGGIAEREENEEQKQRPHRLVKPHNDANPLPSSDDGSLSLNAYNFEPRSHTECHSFHVYAPINHCHITQGPFSTLDWTETQFK